MILKKQVKKKNAKDEKKTIGELLDWVVAAVTAIDCKLGASICVVVCSAGLGEGDSWVKGGLDSADGCDQVLLLPL